MTLLEKQVEYKIDLKEHLQEPAINTGDSFHFIAVQCEKNIY